MEKEIWRLINKPTIDFNGETIMGVTHSFFMTVKDFKDINTNYFNLSLITKINRRKIYSNKFESIF